VDNKVHEMTSWNFDALATELRELDWKGMELYFPDVDKLVDISVGLPVSGGGQLDDFGVQFTRNEREEVDPARIRARNERDMNDLVEVMCPECGAIFCVSAEEIRREKAQSEKLASEEDEEE